jgi:hypothetical protein
MKTMSYVFTLVAILITTSMFAQEYKIPVENSKDGKLTLDDFMGDFTITGYDGKEIIISPLGGIDDTTVPERAKGLKPIYGNGMDNTGIGLKMEKNGNQVTLICLMPITKRREYNVKVPDNFSLKVKSDCARAKSIIVQDMKSEVEIKTCQSITIKNVTGSLVLATINGNIDVDNCGSDKDQTISLATVNGSVNVKFTEFNTTNPISLSTVNGGVDVTLPSKAAANIKMSTISGTLYSDFDFTDTGKKMKQVGGSQVNSTINGGGTELNLGTVNGNVYLRKGK